MGNGQWNQPRLRELIGSALFRSEPFYDFEVDHDFPHIGRRVMRLNGRRIPFPQAERRVLLLSIEDVTERREIAEIRHQRLFETAKDGILVVDMESQTVQDVNPHFGELTGYPREELVGRNIVDIGRKLGWDDIANGIRQARESERVRYDDLELKTRGGDAVRVDVIGNTYTVGSQPVIQFNVRDVSVRFKALKDLRDSEQRFRLFVESVADFALFQMDPDGIIISWNPGAERLLGWKEQEVVGKPGSVVFTREDVADHAPEKEIETARRDGRAEDERWHLRKDGSRFNASGVLTRICDEQQRLIGFAKVMRDVTERRRQEEQLRRSLTQKDTLVREIHHRVKNNLQVIISLLSMQSRHTRNTEVLAAFQDAEDRLRAIAHIHERLYASDDLSDIEFGGYVTGLAKELVQLHSTHPHQIQLNLDVPRLALDIERAIPLGLIANELIMNSIKHGLREGSGSLTVKLSIKLLPVEQDRSKDSATKTVELLIADTGPGLPPGTDMTKAKSMGLRLVSMLVRQLRGRMEVGSGPGTAISFTFPLHISAKPEEGEK